MTDGSSSVSGMAEYVPAALPAVGCLLFTGLVGIKLAFDGGGQLFTPSNLVSYAVGIVLSGSIAGCGYWLARSDVATIRYGRVAGWCLVGVCFSVALNLPLIASTPALPLEETVLWGHYAITTGTTGGALVGINEGRAIERARAAERAEVRAERAETERSWLDYLNSLLRHEVLNNANVIAGYAELARAETDGDLDDYLETIRHQSEDMTRVIRDIRVLIDATRDARTIRAVDLSTCLADELEDIRATYEDVEIDASLSDDVRVLADDLLPRVFGNLLSNAVEHNDSSTPRVEVSVESTPENVFVRITDDGPGVPESERETLFERSGRGDHGLGLYLSRVLVDRYGGSVELADTGGEGSTFTVSLPRANESVEASGPPFRPAGLGDESGRTSGT